MAADIGAFDRWLPGPHQGGTLGTWSSCLRYLVLTCCILLLVSATRAMECRLHAGFCCTASWSRLQGLWGADCMQAFAVQPLGLVHRRLVRSPTTSCSLVRIASKTCLLGVLSSSHAGRVPCEQGVALLLGCSCEAPPLLGHKQLQVTFPSCMQRCVLYRAFDGISYLLSICILFGQ
jgi:hypothetical protein